jgi:hypothetical protein
MMQGPAAAPAPAGASSPPVPPALLPAHSTRMDVIVERACLCFENGSRPVQPYLVFCSMSRVRVQVREQRIPGAPTTAVVCACASLAAWR